MKSLIYIHDRCYLSFYAIYLRLTAHQLHDFICASISFLLPSHTHTHVVSNFVVSYSSESDQKQKASHRHDMLNIAVRPLNVYGSRDTIFPLRSKYEAMKKKTNVNGWKSFCWIFQYTISWWFVWEYVYRLHGIFIVFSFFPSVIADAPLCLLCIWYYNAFWKHLHDTYAKWRT